ncbi:MAG: DUF2334 domain-containing protein [Candidatus Neomarinimicrobiota bacterium]
MIKRLALITLFWIACSHALMAQDSLIFMIRIDDILCRNETILPRSIQPFESACNSRGAKVTWGVIPHRLIENINQDGALVQELFQTIEKGNEVAFHGYNHICIFCGSSHEFYCTNPSNPHHLTYAQQDSLIKNGIQVFQDKLGFVPGLFIPPGHAVDTTTYRVLIDNHFDRISMATPYKEYVADNLYNLGMQSEYTWAMTSSNYSSQLTAALANIRSFGKTNGFYCVLAHDYFIRQGYENGIVIRWFGELIDSLKVSYGDRVRFMTITDAINHYTGRPTEIDRPLITNADGFRLQQNYPNPFNASTTITYSIPKVANICLEVFDQSGRKVAELVNRRQSAGSYSVRWNAERFSSGLYFYRLRMNGQTSTKKCLLVK